MLEMVKLFSLDVKKVLLKKLIDKKFTVDDFIIIFFVRPVQIVYFLCEVESSASS